MKRTFDFVVAVLGLVVLSPVLAMIALLIRMFDGPPILFHQERVGYRGKPFRIRKFRTMVRDAETLDKQLTVGDDPRITGIGCWLRKTKLDELPQLFNVLIGEMSLVGPRPEVPRYVDHYTPDQRSIFELMPGITDAASILYRNESELLKNVENPERTYIEVILPDKIRLNLQYAERASILRDFAVILKTLRVLGRRDASGIGMRFPCD